MEEYCEKRSSRRTNSFASLQEYFPVTKEPNQNGPTESVPAKPTRFRRASFALLGDRPTTLNELIDAAAVQATNVAASLEAAKISALGTPPPETSESANLEDTELYMKRFSTATIVPGAPSYTNPDIVFSGSSSDEMRNIESTLANRRKYGFSNCTTTLLDEQTPPISSSNPLSSELIKRYFAALAVDTLPTDESDGRLSTASPSPVECENVPGVVPISSQAVASMIIPVQQIRRAHASTSSVPRLPPGLRVSCDRPRRNLRSCRVEPLYTMTDVTSSSGLSDTEMRRHMSFHGYLSDQPAIDMASQVKRLEAARQRLDADLQRSTTSIPRSPKRSRARPGRISAVERFFSPSTSPPSSQSSKFDLSHVYDGLPQPYRKASSSVSALNLPSEFPQLAQREFAARSPIVNTSQTFRKPTDQSATSTIRSIFDQFKPQPQPEDSGRYIYMDEETRERRAKARASNVISPVSF